ncbi:hypothetical protein IX56_05170 [Paracoccus sanguinis]|uniref:Uncharacterized protein n=1 Tax=Paracoccus sanguinis TaxID=1545044 RepID=A0A099GK40_9RHOB|nr:hypothetical protein IX56_05170 [Paracoccus sanguinis]
MVSNVGMTSDANLGNIQVRDRRFYFGVEVGFNVTGIQFDDKCKARRLLVDVLNRLGFPPSRHWVDSEEISPCEIRGGTTKLVDVQGTHITPVATEDPAVIVSYRIGLRVIGQLVYPCLELCLVLVGSVQLEPQIMGGIAEFRAASRFRRIGFDKSAECHTKSDFRRAQLPERLSWPRQLEEFHMVVDGFGSSGGAWPVRGDRVLNDEGQSIGGATPCARLIWHAVAVSLEQSYEVAL